MWRRLFHHPRRRIDTTEDLAHESKPSLRPEDDSVWGTRGLQFVWIYDTVRSRGGRCAYAIVPKNVVTRLRPMK